MHNYATYIFICKHNQPLHITHFGFGFRFFLITTLCKNRAREVAPEGGRDKQSLSMSDWESARWYQPLHARRPENVSLISLSTLFVYSSTNLLLYTEYSPRDDV